LIRRSQIPDELPGDYKINAGQDIMISVYNIHHSSKVLLDVLMWKNVSFIIMGQIKLLGLNLANMYTFVKKFGDEGIFKSQ
jgi:hypothetical protein